MRNRSSHRRTPAIAATGTAITASSWKTGASTSAATQDGIPTHPTVPASRVAQHPAIGPDSLGDDPLPHPAARVGSRDCGCSGGPSVTRLDPLSECTRYRRPRFAEVPVDTKGELDILARERPREALELQHHVATPDRKCADGTQHVIPGAPGVSRGDERPQIVERLVRDQRMGRSIAPTPLTAVRSGCRLSATGSLHQRQSRDPERSGASPSAAPSGRYTVSVSTQQT